MFQSVGMRGKAESICCARGTATTTENVPHRRALAAHPIALMSPPFLFSQKKTQGLDTRNPNSKLWPPFWGTGAEPALPSHAPPPHSSSLSS